MIQALQARVARSAARHDRGAGLAAVVLGMTGFSWGFIIVKVLPLDAVPLAAWRLTIGAVVLTAAALLLRTPWPRTRAVALIAGLAFTAHQILFIVATQRTSIAIVTLIGALQPLMVSLVSRKAVGEVVPAGLVVSSFLAIAGVAVVVAANWDDASRSLAGDLLAVANVFVFTTYFLMAKRARLLGAPTLTLTAAVMWVGAAVTVPVALLTGASMRLTATSFGLIVLLAMLPGNGHLLVNWAHRRVSAALTSVVLAGIPVLAGLWAHLVLGEPFGVRHLGGMLLVALAVWLGQRAERRARRAADGPAVLPPPEL